MAPARRLRDDLPHITREHLTEIMGVARERAPLIPKDRERLKQRSPLMCDAQRLKSIAMKPHVRRDDGDTMPCFSK